MVYITLCSMKLRYFFDPGSGTCLWSADDEARMSYGYAVTLEELPISEAARAEGHRLATIFDTSIDWNDPGGQSPWTAEHETRFRESSDALHAVLVAELRTRFEIANEVRFPKAV